MQKDAEGGWLHCWAKITQMFDLDRGKIGKICSRLFSKDAPFQMTEKNGAGRTKLEKNYAFYVFSFPAFTFRNECTQTVCKIRETLEIWKGIHCKCKTM